MDDFRQLEHDYRQFKNNASGGTHIMNGTFGDALWLGDVVNTPMASTVYSEEPSSIDGQAAVSSESNTQTPPSTSSSPGNVTSQAISSIPLREKPASSPMSLVTREVPRECAISTPSQSTEHARPRIGHRKSRAGCFNCKRRKIKCQENQPECHNCMRKNLRCVYPVPKTMAALRDSAIYSPSPMSAVNLQATPQIFTLADMRLFHHFLLDAYPHLPVGNDSTWLSHVPLLAHHNEFLMHGILALAASHLEILTHAPLATAAMYHRMLAIRGTNEAMSKINRTGSDGDALLASCYLLTFQSTYMDDGINEFFLFVRGCSLVAGQLNAENIPTVFLLHEGSHFKFMEDKLQDLPIIHCELLDGAERSLLALPALFTSPVHFKAWNLLIQCIHGIRKSSLVGYFMFITIYAGIINFSKEEFADFTDLNNEISRVIIAHFFSIQMMLFPILDREWSGRSKLTPSRTNVTWVSSIRENLPPSFRHLADWPNEIMKTVQDELRGKDSVVPRLQVLRKKEGLSRNIA